MTGLFDTHFHLNHEDFSGIEEETWRSANEAGVRQGVVIGYDLASSRRAVEVAEMLGNVYAAVGVSPHEILKTEDGYIDQLRGMASHPKVVAIGEAGLEYYYPVGQHDVQQREFINQARLADELDLPLVIHLRDADDDFLKIWQEQPPKSAILHCFTATERVMRRAVELGHYVSFSGIVTFKKSTDLHHIASIVPEDNLLIETDSPYLAPVPYRGKRCEPAMVAETAKKVAELRGMPFEQLAEITTRNARRVFRLEEC